MKHQDWFPGSDIHPGRLVGADAILQYNRSLFDVVAREETFIGVLPRSKLHELGTRFPRLLLAMSERLSSVLPQLLRIADFAIGWNQYQAGQIINEHRKR
jgi:hypothetical protein